MSIQGLDIIFLTLIIIAVSAIIGLNIVNVIDKKISEITVNMPQINVPKPEVSVKILPGCKKNAQTDVTYEEVNPNAPEYFVQMQSDNISIERPNPPKPQQRELKKGYYGYEYFTQLQLTEPNNAKTAEIKEDRKLKKKYFSNEDEEDYIGGLLECTLRRRQPFAIQPDQIQCNAPNNKTAENYYRYYYKYPFIPNVEKEKWLPANYSDYPQYGSSNLNIRIVPRGTKKLPDVGPFGYNYYFDNSGP